MQEEIRVSPRAKGLLGGRDRIFSPEPNVYASWRGAHWTLAMLSEIGYPEEDDSLVAMRDQVLDTWLGNSFYKEIESKSSNRGCRLKEWVTTDALYVLRAAGR